LNAAESSAANVRPNTSAVPPGPKATTILTGFEGHASCDRQTELANTAATMTPTQIALVIVELLRSN
jgi:hypothetical protein